MAFPKSVRSVLVASRAMTRIDALGTCDLVSALEVSIPIPDSMFAHFTVRSAADAIFRHDASPIRPNCSMILPCRANARIRKTIRSDLTAGNITNPFPEKELRGISSRICPLALFLGERSGLLCVLRIEGAALAAVQPQRIKTRGGGPKDSAMYPEHEDV
jgi:hypothetical protein